MTVVGITMVKDEQDVIGTTLRHMATQVDAVVIADNMSTDKTREIIEEVTDEAPVQIHYIWDEDPAYQQSEKMTKLAHLAHARFGATWIVPFDADEIWTTPNRIRTLADELHWVDLYGSWSITADVYDHVATGIDVPELTNPIQRLKWRRRDPNPLPKVAARYSPDLVIEMGNHGAHWLPDEWNTRPVGTGLMVHHFPYRSAGQVIGKVRNGAAAYAVTDLPEHFGAHWRQWGKMLDTYGEPAIEELFYKWYYRQDPLSPLNIDGEIQGPLKFDPVL